MKGDVDESETFSSFTVPSRLLLIDAIYGRSYGRRRRDCWVGSLYEKRGLKIIIFYDPICRRVYLMQLTPHGRSLSL